jgi:hypothetical protein
MKISPSLPNTRVTANGAEWIPASFDGFLHELHHVVDSCRAQESLVLFRGHRKREWLLDSTFARSFKTTLFQIPPEQQLPEQIVQSHGLHSAVLNLYLFKFEVLVRPSAELEAAAEEHGVDPWFELMKRIQQYPDKTDHPLFLKGTNFLDWTHSPDVALYFANEERNGDGAIFICDATATGKTLQILPVAEILEKMRNLRNAGQALGSPLMFSPPKQVLNQRAKNQQAVYFAQMDLRYDLDSIWKFREAGQPGNRISIKLILPAGTEAEARNYLERRGTTRDFIYPDASTV